MAMLAEPRRKVRYVINPSGKDWFAGGGGGDAAGNGSGQQFGQRMLQTMGWQAGQGLGKRGQGAAEPLAVKRKSDQRGVGCTSAYAAETMSQNVDFASLLSELNAAHGGGGGDTGVAAAPVTTVSLEAKSRSSRARLHYQKFTRGKDVSAYDKQSLACIFGSREARQKDDQRPDGGDVAPAEDLAGSLHLHRSRSAGCLQSREGHPAEEEPSKHGLQLVQSQTSLQDYFRVKMEELQRRRRQQEQSAADHAAPSNMRAVQDEADRASWTSESSCSAASTAASAPLPDRADAARRTRVRFLPAPAPPPAAAPAAAAAAAVLVSPVQASTAATQSGQPSDEFVVIDFNLFPGSAFQRVLGYPLY